MSKLLSLFTLFLLLLSACSSEQQESAQQKTDAQEPPPATQIPLEQARTAFSSITAQQAQQLIATNKDLLILDTRTTREIINDGAIAGAQQTSLRDVFQDTLAIAKDRPVLVVCAVGGRSFAAGKIMVRNGFKEVYNLRGGLNEWKQNGLPVVYPKQ